MSRPGSRYERGVPASIGMMGTAATSNCLPPPRAVYVHVPFCEHRCGYCNFTVVAGREDLHAIYLEALERELQGLGHPRPVDTLYLGGGTPTQLPAVLLEKLCGLIRQWFPPQPGYEWSIEANPYGLDAERLAVLATSGVNRLSLGVQSFSDRKLAILERNHRGAEIRGAVQQARTWLPNVSFDLIFGVPGETLAEWQADLRAALALQPDHLSVYGLTYERGARFLGRVQRGLLRPVAEDLECALFEWTLDALAASRWDHYEISNFARPGRRCRHNIVYWTGGGYFAAGPGAARYVDGRRELNHRSTLTYVRRVLAGQSPVSESESLAPEARARERLVFQLRMLEGVALQQFAHQTGYNVAQLGGAQLREFVRLGFLEQIADRLRLTRRGLMISDALWPALL